MVEISVNFDNKLLESGFKKLCTKCGEPVPIISAEQVKYDWMHATCYEEIPSDEKIRETSPIKS